MEMFTVKLVPPPYEGGGPGGGWFIRKNSNPLLHLPLHKGEKFLCNALALFI
jgi:hypothetical protein